MKSGAPKPDISSADALKRALLAAKSIAYSDSASGVYVSTELFQRLGIADAMKGKARKIPTEPVAGVVGRCHELAEPKGPRYFARIGVSFSPLVS